MFENTNPYDLREEIDEGITKYFISFTDGQAIRRETEISRPVYLEFLRFIKKERNLRRWDERHIEKSQLTDASLFIRGFYPQRSVEEVAFESMRNKQFQLTLKSLPEIQRRRFVLHHEFGLTYEQIAEMEGCSDSSVSSAVRRAMRKIKSVMKM